MASPRYFRGLGLFVQPRFLEPSECASIRRRMLAAPAQDARIAAAQGDGWTFALDRDSKRASVSQVGEPARSLVAARVGRLMPRLERHFSVELESAQPPVFLRYDEGGFAKAHRDVLTPERTRKIPLAAIILLNAPDSAEGFGGGSLRFYGLVPGGDWKGVGLPLDAREGLLIAFRTDLVHEVTPVTSGRRFSVVVWFERR